MAARTSGLDRGFQIYDDEIADSRRSGADTVFRALDWLGSNGEEPFFLFVHLFDAHGPYSSPAEFQQMFQSEAPGPQLRAVPPYQEMRDEQGQLVRTVNPYIDRYDSSIRFIDDLVAALIDSVDLTNTVVIVAADHGESLNERYWKRRPRRSCIRRAGEDPPAAPHTRTVWKAYRRPGRDGRSPADTPRAAGTRASRGGLRVWKKSCPTDRW